MEDEMRIKNDKIALLGKMNEEMLVLYCVLEHEFDFISLLRLMLCCFVEHEFDFVSLLCLLCL